MGDSLFFPEWQEVLAASDLTSGLKAAHAREVARFLYHCEQCHAAPTVEVARQYLADEPAASTPPREALRWLFRASRSAAANAVAERTEAEPVSATTAKPRSLPSIGRQDLGGVNWERDLVIAIRRQGFLWRMGLKTSDV